MEMTPLAIVSILTFLIVNLAKRRLLGWLPLLCVFDMSMNAKEDGQTGLSAYEVQSGMLEDSHADSNNMIACYRSCCSRPAVVGEIHSERPLSDVWSA